MPRNAENLVNEADKIMFYLTRTILIAICISVVVLSTDAQGYNSDNWFPVYVNGKAGYIDRTGKVVLEPKYDGASYFSEGFARVSVGRDTIITAGFSQGFIDETGPNLNSTSMECCLSFLRRAGCGRVRSNKAGS